MMSENNIYMENKTNLIDSYRKLSTGEQYLEVKGLIEFLNLYRKESRIAETKDVITEIIIALSTMKHQNETNT
jgi:hypothetical protein